MNIANTFKSGTLKIYDALKKEYPKAVVMICVADVMRICDDDLEVFKKHFGYMNIEVTTFKGRKIGKCANGWMDTYIRTVLNLEKLEAVVYDAEKHTLTVSRKVEI